MFEILTHLLANGESKSQLVSGRWLSSGDEFSREVGRHVYVIVVLSFMHVCYRAKCVSNRAINFSLEVPDHCAKV